MPDNTRRLRLQDIVGSRYKSKSIYRERRLPRWLGWPLKTLHALVSWVGALAMLSCFDLDSYRLVEPERLLWSFVVNVLALLGVEWLRRRLVAISLRRGWTGDRS